MFMKIAGALLTGLAQGSMIALVALGYTMVYGILKLINFAHSEVFMMGAFIGLFAITALGGESAPLVAGVGGIQLKGRRANWSARLPFPRCRSASGTTRTARSIARRTSITSRACGVTAIMRN